MPSPDAYFAADISANRPGDQWPRHKYRARKQRRARARGWTPDASQLPQINPRRVSGRTCARYAADLVKRGLASNLILDSQRWAHSPTGDRPRNV